MKTKTKTKMIEEEYMKEYKSAIGEIDEKIEKRMREELNVRYSAYELGDNRVPIDNIDEVAFEGRVSVICNVPSIINPEAIIITEIMESPTCLDLTMVANNFMLRTGDYHHRFFEGYEIVGESHSRVTLIEFHMGS